MQSSALLEPTVRIRTLKKDRVNFVLENADLAYAQTSCELSHALTNARQCTTQFRQFCTESNDGGYSNYWCVVSS